MQSSLPTVISEYKLCSYCVKRQGDGEGFSIVAGPECFVCGGLMDRVPSLAAQAVKKVRRYQFDTFAVGVMLPGGIQEKEDELRSNLKLKGNETIKTQAAKIVAALVAAKLGKEPNRMKPGLTILLNLETGEPTVSSRPVFYYGRYAKPAGVSQRMELCPRCQGSGCKKCDQTGFDRKPSVESLLKGKLAGFTGSKRMTFTWLGSEDRESRVFPPGRPFLAEVKSPVKRQIPKKFAANVKRGRVSVWRGKVLPSKPIRLPSFRFRTEITAVSKSKTDEGMLAELRRTFRKATVTFDRPHDKPTSKTVYRVEAKAKGRKLAIDAELDGGLPVKRFVSGELVSPSVSEVLKTEVRCRSFDIREVKEKGKFEFAEVTRV